MPSSEGGITGCKFQDVYTTAVDVHGAFLEEPALGITTAIQQCNFNRGSMQSEF